MPAASYSPSWFDKLRRPSDHRSISGHPRPDRRRGVVVVGEEERAWRAAHVEGSRPTAAHACRARPTGLSRSGLPHTLPACAQRAVSRNMRGAVPKRSVTASFATLARTARHDREILAANVVRCREQPCRISMNSRTVERALGGGAPSRKPCVVHLPARARCRARAATAPHIDGRRLVGQEGRMVHRARGNERAQLQSGCGVAPSAASVLQHSSAGSSDGSPFGSSAMSGRGPDPSPSLARRDERAREPRSLALE